MSDGSRRTLPLPPGWKQIRRVIMLRDKHICQWGSIPEDRAEYGQCSRVANEADHIGDPGDHSYENLRALCGHHHQIRSSSQGGAVKRQMAELKNRPKDKHPGLIENPPVIIMPSESLLRDLGYEGEDNDC